VAYDSGVMTWFANLAYFAAAMVYLPVVVYQMIFQGKNRRGWSERFGFIRLRPVDRKRIWVHAVSLGEVNATRQIIAKLKKRLPDREIVISTTTDTGYARACQLYGTQSVFRYPLDFSWIVARVLTCVDPELIVLMELEVWYNFVRMANRRGVAVAIANGRLTERSARRFGMVGEPVRSMFADLTWVGAQDDAIAERFRSLGTAREAVTVTGSVKWDTAEVCDTVEGADTLAEDIGLDRSQPLLVCGSTGPGEEKIILDAYRRMRGDGASVRLVLVPRKPERFEEVARLIRREGFACIRRSQTRDGAPQRLEPDAIVLGDTMGELRKFYALADVVFVGRSLVPMGGSDPMEVAALAKPILVGPHIENFRAPVEAFQAREAINIVRTGEELAQCVRRLCGDPALAKRQGTSARDVVVDHQGATEITVETLAKLVLTSATGAG
jgi:3-deoxy-D-manno-octulosonic-acid transferase